MDGQTRTKARSQSVGVRSRLWGAVGRLPCSINSLSVTFLPDLTLLYLGSFAGRAAYRIQNDDAGIRLIQNT